MEEEDGPMDFYGLNKTTLLDYPGHVAATLFTGRCNFRCPFCHNKDLLEVLGEAPLQEEEILEFLQKRRTVLQGVCITGGEPTLQPGLEEFIRKLKEMGYLVKLDTNGGKPEVLARLLSLGVLDYVAMDVKAAPCHYATAAGRENVLAQVRQSVEMLKGWSGMYEFRTTVVKGIHTKEEFADIATWLEGCRAYYLQSYRENENVLCKGYTAFSKEELEEICSLLKSRGILAFLRGIE